jgi:hypothetical protein
MLSLYTHRYDSADHRRLGAIPLVVLGNVAAIQTMAGVSITYGNDAYLLIPR